MMTKLETEKIYTEYKEKVEKDIFRERLPIKHDAEDLVSSVFLKVYHNIDSFDNSKGFNFNMDIFNYKKHRD